MLLLLKIATITNSNIVQLNESQTLTLKTLTSPVIDNIKNILQEIL
jgi:hypothetical protein